MAATNDRDGDDRMNEEVKLCWQSARPGDGDGDGKLCFFLLLCTSVCSGVGLNVGW